jgi:hypothetical protein
MGYCKYCEKAVTEPSSYVETPENEYVHQECSQSLHESEKFIVQLHKFLDAAGECTDADELEKFVQTVKELGLCSCKLWTTLAQPVRCNC